MLTAPPSPPEGSHAQVGWSAGGWSTKPASCRGVAPRLKRQLPNLASTTSNVPSAVFSRWQLAGSTTSAKSVEESSTPVPRSTYSWKPKSSLRAERANWP